MDDNFSKDFFKGNRQRLRERVGQDALIVVTANGLLQRNGDMAFHFRQDSSFWYLTGIAEPDIVLVMEPDDEYLILPERSVVRQVFDGMVTAAMLTGRSGVATVLGLDDGWKRLGRRLKRRKAVHTPQAVPPYVEQLGFYANPARAALTGRLKEANGTIEIIDVREHLMRLRAVKQPVEIEAIQRAVDVTAEVLLEVIRPERLAAYQYEYEIEADITRHFRRQAMVHSFDPIVAGGPRACQLHNMANVGKLAAGELLVLDIGAEAGLYAADISRTTVIGQASDRQRQVFEAVCAVQDFAYGLLRPGTVNVDYEKQVEQFMGEQLVRLGVIRKIDKHDHDAVRKYFPHATTHFLGLDAHDVGDYRQPMEPGMVMVCEPGIYLPEEGIGVRIEDDLVITEDGHRVLSSGVPRDLLNPLHISPR